MLELDLQKANDTVRDMSPQQIIQWALNLGEPTITTTSFGPNSALMLHLISSIDSSVPVVWVDSGYNMRDTYVVAEEIMQTLPLNMDIYTPAVTAERLNSILGGIPTLDEPEQHQEFTRIVKLDPFRKALEAHQPKVWISSLRQSESEFRAGLDILSFDNRGILKVAPIFDWSDEQVESYMAQHQLPSCKHYFDPTKIETGRECGLHTAA